VSVGHIVLDSILVLRMALAGMELGIGFAFWGVDSVCCYSGTRKWECISVLFKSRYEGSPRFRV